MKAILNLLKRDLIRSYRDNILLYVILSPVLLAVIAVFILPVVTNPQYSIIAETGLENEFDFSVLPDSDIEFLDSVSVEEKILTSDAMIGITKNNEQIEISLSRTAAEEVEAYLKNILIPFLNEESIETEGETEGSSGRTDVKGYALVFLLMTTMLLGGMVAGFLIVEERSGRTLHSTAVSPIGIKKYIASKSIISFSIPYFIGIVVNFIIIGSQWSWGLYTLASISALPLGILFATIMGYVADNQISAMGIVKLMMPIFLTLPIVSIFVPPAFKWVFYIFPNYWMFESLKFVYLPAYTNDAGSILSVGSAFILGATVLFLFLPRCAKRLGLR